LASRPDFDGGRAPLHAARRRPFHFREQERTAMRLIRPLLAAAGVALFGTTGVLHGLDLYLALRLERFLPRHAADGTGGFADPPSKPPAAAP
jgi:hypothetical protein